jgi:hypothetical protein
LEVEVLGVLVIPVIVVVVLAAAVLVVVRSTHRIGPNEVGLAKAVGFGAQREAIGELPTALVAMANAVAEGNISVVPDVLVTGGGSSIDGLAAVLMRALRDNRAMPSPGRDKAAPPATTEDR